MVVLCPFKKSRSLVIVHECDSIVPSFHIHPSTSELAEALVHDPTALNGENYSGIYDDAGDYVPQYCDNPEDIPQGALVPNKPASQEPSSSASDAEPSNSPTSVEPSSE